MLVEKAKICLQSLFKVRNECFQTALLLSYTRFLSYLLPCPTFVGQGCLLKLPLNVDLSSLGGSSSSQRIFYKLKLRKFFQQNLARIHYAYAFI